MVKNPKVALLALGIAVLLAFAGLTTLLLSEAADKTESDSMIRVACVGDSITEGSGYPDNLQIMLGPEYDVGNFGVSGSTVSLNSERPYMNAPARAASKAFQPSIVVIMLGTNDAQASGQFDGDFSEDYKTLISDYQALLSEPEIWLVKPPPIFENQLNLSDASLEQGIIPQIEEVADELDLPVIDVYSIMASYPEYFMDGVHPSSEGASVIANQIIQAIISNSTSSPF
jgi:lysophospholipase L1-like esterase